MRSLLVTGGQGSLGQALVRHGDADGWDVTAPGRDQLDVTDTTAVAEAVGALRPDVVVHAAAATDVDRCDREPDWADAVNARGTAAVARACARSGARLVAVSTDLVFGGLPPRTQDGERLGWRADDPTAPVQVYGHSKRRGELLALDALDDVAVARTAVLAGPGLPGFVGKVAARALEGAPLTVVDDQHGCPTFVDDLAPALLELAAADVTGVVHRCGSGHVSRHGLAEAVVAWLGVDAPVARVATADLPGGGGAPRPAWSVLDQSRATDAGLRPMPAWREALGRFLTRLGHAPAGSAA